MENTLKKIGRTYDEQNDIYKIDDILAIIDNGELVINTKIGFSDFDNNFFVVPKFDSETSTIEQVKNNILNLQAVKVNNYITTVVSNDDENGDDEYSITDISIDKKYIFKLEDNYDDENCEEYTEIKFSDILIIKFYDNGDTFYFLNEMINEDIKDEYIKLIEPIVKSFDYEATEFEDYNKILEIAKKEQY